MTQNLTVLADRLRIDPDEHATALRRLFTREQMWLIVSGKMFSGKDTVAPQLTGTLPGEVKMPRYGDLMRADLAPTLTDLNTMVRANAGTTDMVEHVAHHMDLREEYAAAIVEALAPEIAARTEPLTPLDRTVGIRFVLQELGSTWRTQTDEDYWAREAALVALPLIGAGYSVITTGGRFLPDVDIPRASAATLLRLDITRATQLERMKARDGIEPTPEALAALDHEGETALDDYAFDVRVDNDGVLGDTLTAARAGLSEHWQLRAAA